MSAKPRTRAGRVIAFIETYCVVPEGALVGKPLRLEKFQKDFIRAVYDNPKGTRRAILSIARKNGKSGLIAGILLAHLVGPEAKRNSQIVSGAMSRDQAALVFALAAKMVQLSERLSRIVKIIPSGKRLSGLPLNVEYRALSADGTTAHGLSPVLAILDEVGQVRGPKSDFVDAITTSQGAHAEPLLVVISTQAPTDADLLSIWIDDAMAGHDEQTVCLLHAAPDDCELTDPKAWKAANPALGKFRDREDVRRQADEAVRLPSAEARFRNLILNQRVEAHSPFVSRSVWTLNAGEPAPWHGREVYAGLDLSSTTDLTALVAIWRDDADLWHVHPWFWAPEKGLEERARRDRVPYDVWARQGHLLTTPGAAVDYDFVGQFLLELADECDLRVAFDRWRMGTFRQSLARLGASDEFMARLTEFGQGFASISPALDLLEGDLINGRMRHGAHPVLTMCAGNAVVIRDPAGNRKLDKSKSTGRIDGMVALTMARGLAGADTSEAGGSSYWDSPDYALA